jgi:hypothetical protein
MSRQPPVKNHQKSRSAQKRVVLPGRVEKVLKDYSLGAAGIEKRVKDFSLVAAGVGALALMAPSANADIVYSGLLNTSVAAGHPFNLSLLGNPVLEIRNSLVPVGFFTHTAHGGTAFVTTGHAHSVRAEALGSAHLFFGSVSGAPIASGKAIPGSVAAPVTSQALDSALGGGKFKGGTHDLGFQFGTSHNLHDGWLGIGINQVAEGYFSRTAHGTIFVTTGHTTDVDVANYAYEACAGDPISAGAVSGGATCTSPTPTPEPNMLALLALGAAGLAAVRLRRKTKAA